VKSPVREYRTPGSVRGHPGNRVSYLDSAGFSAWFRPFWPRSRHSVVMGWAGLGEDGMHGFVEGEPLDFDKEVNGVAGLVAFRPAPIAVFD